MVYLKERQEYHLNWINRTGDGLIACPSLHPAEPSVIAFDDATLLDKKRHMNAQKLLKQTIGTILSSFEVFGAIFHYFCQFSWIFVDFST
jgi:hypothetical protein